MIENYSYIKDGHNNHRNLTDGDILENRLLSSCKKCIALDHGNAYCVSPD